MSNIVRCPEHQIDFATVNGCPQCRDNLAERRGRASTKEWVLWRMRVAKEAGRAMDDVYAEVQGYQP